MQDVKSTMNGKQATRDPKNLVMDVDLEDALDLAGAGRYQFVHCSLMLLSLLAALMEMIGIAFVLPAAACDLEVPDSLKGLITSIPNIGIILTAPFWGYAADTLGRKPVLVGTCAAAGLVGIAASIMPGLSSFALCKFATSLFLSCPSSLGFAYACEVLPCKRRDSAVLMCNAVLMVLNTLSPLLAWGILSSDWRYPIGLITLRPWRLLTALYAVPLTVTALFLMTIEESPKFLMMKGRSQEALNVLGKIYTANSKLGVENYCVKSLKNPMEDVVIGQDGSRCELTPKGRSTNAFSLLRPPHLKWMALTGFLMFGLFAILNGLYLFAPDTINKVMELSGDDEGTLCTLINQSEQQNNSTCVDSISYKTFYILVVTTLVYGVVVTAVSMCPVHKRTLLIAMFATVGVACLLSGVLRNKMAAGVMMSALQVTALGIGPLTAYAVHLFPTSLRGTAVGAVMMFGRLGSTVGANIAGLLLASACTTTFYGFTILLFLCTALCFLLPGNHTSSSTENLNGDS